jgi:glycosyltransferase involved in cell wall biosynthesis
MAAKLPPTWPTVEILQTRTFDARTPYWAARGTLKRLVGTDVLLQMLLLRARIEVVSHSAPLGRLSVIPGLSWIPDLQHRRLPHFFAASDRERLDRSFAEACRLASLVIASSENAREDIEKFFPDARGKVRVLRFVACASNTAEGADQEIILSRLGLKAPYVLLPNQFWAHKNHGLVVDALRILKASGRQVHVVCTGNTHDDRQPGYFDEIMRRVVDAGVMPAFTVLGMVSYADLASMMRLATAVLNPSLFEGWSTSVEEAKSLGKSILLSDIPVHREQAPARGVYFDPHDAEALANALWATVTSFDPAKERAWNERASAELLSRRQTFALEYSKIVHEALRTNTSNRRVQLAQRVLFH